ncbi:phage tail tape measure protein [Enterobacter kobei]|uniref:phage tail tape measure protein n=1 Tax=Enterobacter kobei TaxID=208224 RepID=UPI0020035331|nr:phage tail tape measure protein [Enterobacter kobei]MCK6813744.1 phage tail tape measure protein [Enterobacter kobei]MCQ4415265.1 phage tail tape measure protein [Enterobacter kobei]MDK9884597.1 phage tail tape measure protein [Enterobacter kobei]HDC4299282.1 phage tail tape measure protein [Enterobacter kobei]
MTDQIASITLRADVSDLKTASNELDKLGQAAASAVAGADALADATKRVKPSAKEGAEALRAQHQEIKGLLESIDPTVAALGRLEDKQDHLKAVFSKGWLDSEEYEHYQKLLDQTRLKLTDTGEAAARAQIELAATQAAEKQSAALKNLLGSIDPTIRAFNTLDEQYAQLVAHFEAGRINGAQFEHFNQQLEDTRRKLTGIADAMPQALSRQELAAQRAGISIGQYNAALRTLPAQFTDIATQLAGGQSPFLILLQQGWQIKDQFGSVKGAVSGVGSYLRTLAVALTPATLGIGALAVGAGALATAWYQGAQEATEFNKQLILTGRYSAESAGQLSDMALRIGGASGKVSAAARALAQVAGAGTFKPEQLEYVTRAAMAMEQATGQSVDATVKNFQKLYASPTKASEELNSTMHYLTASQYEYISSLERRGDKEGAAEAAAKAYSQAEQQRSTQILDNMGWIERAANATGNAIKGMWDKLLDVGRQETASQQLENIKTEIANFRSGATGWGYKVDTTATNPRLAQLKEQQRQLEFVVKSQEGYAAAQAASKKTNEEAIAAQQVMNKYLDAGTTSAEKRSRAEADLNKQIAANAKAAKATQFLPKDQRVTLWSDADIARARKGIDEMYKEAKTKTPAITMPAGDRTLLNYKAQSLILSDTLDKLKQSGDVQVRNTEYSKVHAHFIELATYAQDNLLSAQEKSKLANQTAIELAAKAVDKKNEELEAQKKINGLAKTMQDEQLKYQAQIRNITDTAGMSSLQRQKFADLQQARVEFEKGGGNLSDTNARSTQEYLKTLDLIDAKYDKLKESQGDWMSGAASSMKDWMDQAADSSKAAGEVINVTMGGAIDSLVDTLNGSASSWKSWGMSVIKIIEKVTMQLAVAAALKAAFDGMSGSSTGWIASIGKSMGGTVANAKGGVYESPVLSKYVNGIYDSPQYFAFQGASKFAKGGVFAEAGPEAIMPLTRDSAGRLGVRAQGGGGSVAPVINTTINIEANGNVTSNTSANGDALGRALASQINNQSKAIVLNEMKPGGAIYEFFKARR